MRSKSVSETCSGVGRRFRWSAYGSDELQTIAGGEKAERTSILVRSSFSAWYCLILISLFVAGSTTEEVLLACNSRSDWGTTS
jgi:hypothetical protein